MKRRPDIDVGPSLQTDSLGMSRVVRLRGVAGEPDEKRGPVALSRAFRPDPTTVLFDDVSTDEEPEPHPG
jgi:hypothetical protein